MRIPYAVSFRIHGRVMTWERFVNTPAVSRLGQYAEATQDARSVLCKEFPDGHGGTQAKLISVKPVRQNPGASKMSKKKRKRKSGKGKLNPGLRRWMAKQRAKKSRRRRARRNPPYKPKTVMKRFRRGTLRSSSGRKVRSEAQARGVLLSELRSMGYHIAPRPNPKRKKKHSRPKLKQYKCGRCKRIFKMNRRPKSCPFCRTRFSKR